MARAKLKPALASKAHGIPKAPRLKGSTRAILPQEVRVHPGLKIHFGYCLYKAAMRMRALLDQALSVHGVITPQFGVLGLLKVAGRLAQSDLCHEMCIDKASMVKLIDHIEQKGWVRRVGDPDDRRVKFVELTPAGLKTYERLVHLREEVSVQFLEPLSPEERRVLREAMPKLLR
jgi:DNA-binding MarR family transcriptional regulator